MIDIILKRLTHTSGQTTDESGNESRHCISRELCVFHLHVVCRVMWENHHVRSVRVPERFSSCARSQYDWFEWTDWFDWCDWCALLRVRCVFAFCVAVVETSRLSSEIMSAAKASAMQVWPGDLSTLCSCILKVFEQNQTNLDNVMFRKLYEKESKDKVKVTVQRIFSWMFTNNNVGGWSTCNTNWQRLGSETTNRLGGSK